MGYLYALVVRCVSHKFWTSGRVAAHTEEEDHSYAVGNGRCNVDQDIYDEIKSPAACLSIGGIKISNH